MKKSNTHFKILMGLVAAILVVLSMASCEDDPAGVREASGPPQLERISLIDKDSTTTEGTRGAQYVIYGKHLESTRSVTFNGVEANINLALASERNMIVTVPNDAPYVNASDSVVVTNSKGSASLPFRIVQPPPTLNSFSPSYAEAGDTVTISGDVFVNVSEVLIGDTEANIISSSQTEVQVEIPEGVDFGELSVTTPGGTSVADYPFGFKFKVYDDALTEFYQGSYGVNVNLESTENVAGGNYAIKTEYTVNYGALLVGYYGATPDLSSYSALKVSIYGGTNASTVQMFLVDEEQYKVPLDIVPGEYTTFSVSLEELGNPATINQLQIQTTGNLFNIWVDNIGFY